MVDDVPATTSLAPAIGPDTPIVFEDARRPGLRDGDYRLSVTQGLGTLGYAPTATARFRVSGPRFALAPTDVRSVFPPSGSRGHVESVLPQVVLARPSLPWERTAAHTEPPDDGPAPPWLAVVVVDAAQEQVRTAGVDEVLGFTWGSGGTRLDTTDADDPTARVRVVRVPAAALPEGPDLEWIAHVRVVGSGRDTVESAVVTATWHPTPGRRHRAHLVSLEALYDIDEHGAATLSTAVGSDGMVDVVSLHSWDFTCQEEDHHGFTRLLEGLSVDHLRVAPPGGGTDTAQRHMESGINALDHHLRQGDTVTSWYHGPLLPGAPPGPAVDLPVRGSDDLLAYDHATDMLDVSYAAAWELGRQLALQDDTLAVRLHEWKRAVAHQQRRVEAMAATPHLRHLHPAPRTTAWNADGGGDPDPGWNPDSGGDPDPGWSPDSGGDPDPGWNPDSGDASPGDEAGLAAGDPDAGWAPGPGDEAGLSAGAPDPGWDPDSGGSPDPGWEDAGSHLGPGFGATTWFTTRLVRLGGIPFRYLVPDEAALPPESLRFFRVDSRWLDCLQDGAFSIGRTGSTALATDALLRRELPTVPSMVGFLLRSDVVSWFPGMVVDAYSQPPRNAHDTTHRVHPVRLDRLAPNVLLGLFDTGVDTLAFHLHPEVLHAEIPAGAFRPSTQDDPPLAVGDDRGQGDGRRAEGDELPGDDLPDNPVSLADLAAMLAAPHAGALGRELLVPVPRVEFTTGAEVVR